MTREAIGDTVEALLWAHDLVIEGAEVGYLTHATYRATRADFSDSDTLIADGGKLAGYLETLIFGRGAANDTGMRLLST